MIATLLVIGTSSALRTRSIRAGIVATATALVVSAVLCSIATTVMYTAWSSPELRAAIVASGGLAEVYTLPIMMIVPGTFIGAIGASVLTLPRRLDLS